jgi:hypothetical protein
VAPVRANWLVCHTIHHRCQPTSHLEHLLPLRHPACGSASGKTTELTQGIGDLLCACRDCHHATSRSVTLQQPSLDALSGALVRAGGSSGRGLVVMPDLFAGLLFGYRRVHRVVVHCALHDDVVCCR